jgi:hypothetical protein
VRQPSTAFIAMPDDPTPPRKHYKFKTAEFASINEVPTHLSLTEAQPKPDPGIVPSTKVRIDVRDLVRASLVKPAATPAAPPTTASTARRNEVHALLQDNLTRADAAGLNEVSPAPKPRGRRKRDYIVTLVAGNLGFAVLAGLSGFNVVGTLFALGGMVLFSCATTWIMWFVMDDY